jgi:predicted ester cyclase
VNNVDLSTVTLDILISQCPEIPSVYLQVSTLLSSVDSVDCRLVFVDLPVRYAQKYLSDLLVNIYRALFYEEHLEVDQ